MPQIVPMKELRNTNEISELCHAKQEPIFGDLVVMSMETYESLLGIADIDSGIAASEAEINAGGELLDAKEVLGTLRKKYFG